MKQILLYSPSILIPIIFNVILFVIFGNYVDPETYGKYNLKVTIINFLYVLVGGVLVGSLLRLQDEFKKDNKLKDLLSTILSMISILIPFLVIIEYLIFKTVLITGALVSYILINFFATYYRNENKFLTYSFIKIIPIFLFVIALSVFIKTPYLEANTVFIIHYLPFLVVSLFLLIIFLLKSKFYFKMNLTVLKTVFAFGSPLILINIVNVIISSSDVFLINYFLGSEELGNYSFTYRTAELIMITLASFIILTFYPNLIRIYNSSGTIEAKRSLSKYFHLQLYLSFPFLIALTFFSSEILSTFFKEYSSSNIIFSLNLVGTFLFSLTFYTNKPYELNKNMKLLLKLVVFCALINIALNLVLIPEVGIVGASISTIVAYSLYLLVSHYMSDPKLKISLNIVQIAKSVSVSILLFFLVYVAHQTVFQYEYSFISILIIYFIVSMINIFFVFKKL